MFCVLLDFALKLTIFFVLNFSIFLFVQNKLKKICKLCGCLIYYLGDGRLSF